MVSHQGILLPPGSDPPKSFLLPLLLLARIYFEEQNKKQGVKSERNLFIQADATNPVQATESRSHLARFISFTLPWPPVIINPPQHFPPWHVVSMLASLSPVASQDCFLLIYWLPHLSAEPINTFCQQILFWILSLATHSHILKD